MQADLVAVSVAGSDAIVHALHRLQVADDAWERALGFTRSETNAGRPPRDVFEIQQAIADRLSVVFNDPDYGKRPDIPREARAKHRVFEAQMARPPRMWATHPMNHEREENAKRHYLYAPEDERSAWELFPHARALREQATRKLAGDIVHEPISSEITLQRLDDLFTQERLKPGYRGLYVNLSPTRHAATVDTLHEYVESESVDMARLYPPSLAADLARWQSLEQEYAQLCALRDGTYVATDGVIRHRGKIIQRHDIGPTIEAVQAERVASRVVLEAVLKRARSQHLAIARSLSPTWHAHLLGMLRVLHYANHVEANLRDANGAMLQCLYRLLSKSRQRADDVTAVILFADAVHQTLERIYADAAFVEPDARVLAEFGAQGWGAVLGELKLGVPTRENINEWLKFAESWVTHTAVSLESLGRLTLNQLLRDEAMLVAASQGAVLQDPPAEVPVVPPVYHTLVIGSERVLRAETPNLWDRFRDANGLVPSVGRAAVALCIVGATLTVGSSMDAARVIVYNDLAQTVVVTVDGQKLKVRPESHTVVSINGGREILVLATTASGEPIDEFPGLVRRNDRFLIYTVAAATPIRAWSATYGSARGTAPELLPPQRWRYADVDYVFTEPPGQIRAVGSAVKTVMDAPKDWSPMDRVSGLGNSDSTVAMAFAHARYDAPDSHNLEDWLSIAATLPGFEPVLAARLQRYPDDVVARRIEQALAKDAAHDAVCARHRALAEASPDNDNFAYLAIRCMPEGPAKHKAFEAAQRRWPRSAWLANALAWDAMEAGRYRDAEAALNLAMGNSEVLRQTRAVDSLRLLRLRDPGTAQLQLQMREQMNADVRKLAAFEPRHSMPVEGIDRAIALLANGRLDEAVATAQDTPVAAYVLRMAAASDGASAALRARAKALAPDAGVDVYSVCLALADGAPSGDPAVKAALERLIGQYGDSELATRIQSFLTQVRKGNVDEAERALDGPMHPALRAHAFVAGIYVLGNRAPAAWPQFAGRALFAVERPYLQLE